MGKILALWWLSASMSWAGEARCVADGILYDDAGAVVGCEDTTRACLGSPPRPGICQASPTCLVDQIFYDRATGVVDGCLGGGNWCSGAPREPGICDRKGTKTVPASFLGQWSYAVGYCRGSSFFVHADRLEYQAGLEPLGTGRIVNVQVDEVGGRITIETILEGRGHFLSLWPSSQGEEEFHFGFGVTQADSLQEYCEVMPWRSEP